MLIIMCEIKVSVNVLIICYSKLIYLKIVFYLMSWDMNIYIHIYFIFTIKTYLMVFHS